MSIPDRSSCGRSKIVPFLADEDASSRHARRMSAAHVERDEFRVYVQSLGGLLEIMNEGHHWRMSFPAWRAEWWPSSAKCVIEKRWNQGLHVHDLMQLRKVLEQETRRRDA